MSENEEKLLKEILNKVSILLSDETESHKQRENILKEQLNILMRIEKILRKIYKEDIDL